MREHQLANHLVLFLLTVLAAVTPARAASLGAQLTSTEKQQLQREARLVVDILQNSHYSGQAFRGIENKEMLARFIEELDPGADFLSADDVAYIHRRFDRTFKSVYLFRGDLQPAFEIFDLFAERAATRLDWVEQRLRLDFDFTVEETIHQPREAVAADAGQPADRRWEQRLKDQLLAEQLLGRTPDEASTTLSRRYAEMKRRIAAVDSLAVRERFFDAIIRSFDPHSGYFSADSAREFEIDMKNAVSGIGLDLRKDEGRCIVSNVQPGGPADLESELAPGDTLLELAEGDAPWVDAARTRLREIVALVRGAEGGKIRLAYQPEGTTQRVEITLTRRRVVLGADRAHGAVSEVPGVEGPRRIGWIVLPNFYAGGEGADTTSAAADIRELLDQMQTRKIDGLVLDLRQNPGGALTEAVAISQLFLPSGMVMLSRGLTGKPTEHPLKTATPAYTGPLVVLTSAHSASASEIFAGTMKFHRRALVVGSASTYGKGTSQAYIALPKLPGIDAKLAKDWGTLRLTAERFYLPDGQAVQRQGVPSHIVLPEFETPGLRREAELPHALSAESLPSGTPITPPSNPLVDEALLRQLRAKAEENFAQLPEWQLWRKEQQSSRREFESETRSLQLTVRQKAWHETLASYQDRQRTRRSLTWDKAYPTEALEIASVQAAYDAHESRWRTLDHTNQRLHRLTRGGFLFETARGRLQAMRISDLSAATYAGDAAELAAAFTAGAGQPVTAEQAHRLLERISLLEHKTDDAILAAAQLAVGETIPAAGVRTGTEALLRRLTELDADWRLDRRGLDIPLRESLRMAAAWADISSRPASP